ncbi:MAG: mechanosensitive ion channel [Cyclobacteriaceae bacterium]
MDRLYIQIAISIGIAVLYLITRRITRRLIIRHGMKHDHEETRVLYVRKLTGYLIALIFLVFIAIVWEISLRGLSIYFASFFTIAGIGLFAQWSILSNVTSSVILFFYFPFKIGSTVRIIDGDNSVEGKVTDITIFSIKIKTSENKIVSYPNNLAIQKPIVEL